MLVAVFGAAVTAAKIFIGQAQWVDIEIKGCLMTTTIRSRLFPMQSQQITENLLRTKAIYLDFSGDYAEITRDCQRLNDDSKYENVLVTILFFDGCNDAAKKFYWLLCQFVPDTVKIGTPRYILEVDEQIENRAILS